MPRSPTDAMLLVIARSEATKQSILLPSHWIASRSLSSGAHSRDSLARNEDPISRRIHVRHKNDRQSPEERGRLAHGALSDAICGAARVGDRVPLLRRLQA